MSTGDSKSADLRLLEDLAILDPRPPAIYQRDLIDEQVRRLNLPNLVARIGRAEKERLAQQPQPPAPRRKGRRS